MDPKEKAQMEIPAAGNYNPILDMENFQKVRSKKETGFGTQKRSDLAKKVPKSNAQVWGPEERPPIFGGGEDD